MSIFDQSFSNQSGCFSICNSQGERQSPIPALRFRLEDELIRTPADRQNKQHVDDMLAKAMSGLSFEDREEQLEILHGVKPKATEDEAFVDAKLQDLESLLSRIKRGSVYEIAEQMDPTYMKARAFRTMFLRANRYEIKDTAENMMKFFELKRKLFGAEKMVKGITLADLDEGDIASLKSGVLQVCGKDCLGRTLYGNFAGLRPKDISLLNELRSRFYIEMCALGDEENKQSDRIHIMFAVGEMSKRFGGVAFGGSGTFELASCSATIPRFDAGLHLCFDEGKEYFFQEAILKAASSQLRSRSRLHFGSQTECLYHLSSYGIPKSFLPVDPKTDQVCLKRHLQWVESRLAKENCGRLLPIITPGVHSITNPNDNDVLVGTGKRYNNIGNKRLRVQVKEFSKAYHIGSSDERKALVDYIINSIQESGGRFLTEHNVDDWNVFWNEMSRDQIRIKVTQAFRNSYRRR